MPEQHTLQRLLISITLLLSAQLFASTDEEYEQLARLLVELKALHLLIDEAQAMQSKNHRQQLNYPALRDDLNQIIDGVSDHLHRKRRDPAELPPIQGAYRQ